MKKQFLKIISATLLSITLALTLSACSHKEKPNQVSVGTIAGPETKLMEVAKAVALQQFGLRVHIVTFTDYNTPNQALNDGDIDANAFQHVPFLLAQVKSQHYNIVPVGDTFLYPMGLYSEKYTKLSDIPDGSTISIPNDPSNEARALLLLQSAGLVHLKSNVTINATTHDIVSNSHHYKIVSLDAAQLPRTLQDVALSAINTNYAVPAHLSISKALFVESTKSPYMNVFAARVDNRNQKKIKELVEAYQSQPVIAEAKRLFGDEAIAGFECQKK